MSMKIIEVKLSNNYIQRKANEVLQTIMFNIEKGNINKDDVTINYISDITYSILINRFGTPPSEKDVFEVAKLVWWKLAKEEFEKLRKEDEL